MDPPQSPPPNSESNPPAPMDPLASSEMDPHQIDHLSALPDDLLITILSLLPTRIAARTSLLSRRFRNLWKASPSVDLSLRYIPFFTHSTYVSMVNSALLSRTPSNPLLRLHLDIDCQLPCNVTDSFITSLLVHVHALGLRHLTINGCCNSEPVLRSIFSISSLESLSIRFSIGMIFPSAIALTRLKSLSINLRTYNSIQVERLVSELCCLEDLQLLLSAVDVCLSSRTIKKLELLLVGPTYLEYEEPYSLRLSMPSLEFLSLKNHGTLHIVPCIHGEVPFIKKVVVTLYDLCPKHTTGIAQFLNLISHVEDLSLDLEEYVMEDYPFPIFLEPGKKVPTFPNLKHLDMSICFHESNFEALVTMVHHCIALESLKLHHKTFYTLRRGKRNAWRSKLPRNGDGNYQYAWFKNLHLGENRKELKKLLTRKCTPKRRRVGS